MLLTLTSEETHTLKNASVEEGLKHWDYARVWGQKNPYIQQHPHGYMIEGYMIARILQDFVV